jgi:hypothetical protein
MQDPTGQAILDALASVASERALRAANPALAARTVALKAFQQQRFRLTYADLLAHARYGGASRFFLDELYGPRDFSQRDAQFQRIVRPLVRLFPAEVVATVSHLAQLHALSESLDTHMAQCLLNAEALSPASYVAAWVQVGRPEARRAQIELTLQVGRSLDAYTAKPLLRHALRMMRGPAAAAGLRELQTFLECGFDTFRGMRGADEFLGTVRSRETQWGATLFAGDPEGAFATLFARSPN